eukprot:tig00022075_g23654.t1
MAWVSDTRRRATSRCRGQRAGPGRGGAHALPARQVRGGAAALAAVACGDRGPQQVRRAPGGRRAGLGGGASPPFLGRARREAGAGGAAALAAAACGDHGARSSAHVLAVRQGRGSPAFLGRPRREAGGGYGRGGAHALPARQVRGGAAALAAAACGDRGARSRCGAARRRWRQRPAAITGPQQVRGGVAAALAAAACGDWGPAADAPRAGRAAGPALGAGLAGPSWGGPGAGPAAGPGRGGAHALPARQVRGGAAALAAAACGDRGARSRCGAARRRWRRRPAAITGPAAGRGAAERTRCRAAGAGRRGALAAAASGDRGARSRCSARQAGGGAGSRWLGLAGPSWEGPGAGLAGGYGAGRRSRAPCGAAARRCGGAGGGGRRRSRGPQQVRRAPGGAGPALGDGASPALPGEGPGAGRRAGTGRAALTRSLRRTCAASQRRWRRRPEAIAGPAAGTHAPCPRRPLNPGPTPPAPAAP